MKRRKFVQQVGLASVGAPFILNNMKFQTVAKKLFNYAKSAEDRVLVIIRLNGGNDGLNTVIPVDQYDKLVTQRSNILIPEANILSITPSLGLHHEMGGMQNLFSNGKLGIVQNVGYPEQNRSHFRSMDIWSTGIVDSIGTTGWLGRYFQSIAPDYPEGYPNGTFPDPFAISMGYEVSSTCQGLVSNFSHAVNNPFDTFSLITSSQTNDGSYYGSHMEYLSVLIEQSNEYGSRINGAANAGDTQATYDENNQLAKHLRSVAQMISGGLETKVYILNVNGFDTHDAQCTTGDPLTGTHANLMKMVSDAVKSFQDDLELLGIEQRVAGMTFSEFGRQYASNASFGTDHGDAAPLFLFGACIDNQVVGPNPTVPDTINSQEAVQMQIDFRDVYASILKDWFGVSEAEIQTYFETPVNFISLLGACNVGLDELENNPNAMLLFPNPASSKTTLRLNGSGERAVIVLYDLNGRRIKEVFNGELEAKEHLISIELDGLAEGQYLVEVQTPTTSRNVRLMKVKGL